MLSADITLTLSELIASIIFGTSTTYLLFFVNRKYHKYKLRKNLDTRNVYKVILPPMIKEKFDKVNIENIPVLFRNKIKEFVEKLEKIVPKEILVNFYNNINEANIKISPKLAFRDISGVYRPYYNEMGLSLLGLFKSLNHELLHLASGYTYREKDGGLVVGCGFVQSNKYNSLGKGLNEGYTAYLDTKYFSPNKKYDQGYDCLAQICELVELLVGEDVMKESYFLGNLKKLTTYFGGYNTKESVNMFIQDCDFLVDFYGKNNLLIKKEKEEIEEKLKRIYKFLITSYYVKTFYVDKGLRFEYTNDEERENKYTEFINKIPRTLKSGIRNYNVINDEDIMDAVNDAKYLIETENIRLAEYSRR